MGVDNIARKLIRDNGRFAGMVGSRQSSLIVFVYMEFPGQMPLIHIRERPQVAQQQVENLLGRGEPVGVASIIIITPWEPQISDF